MPVLNSQVQTILNKLRSRDVGLRWIADEITSVIERGKPSMKIVTEPGQKRSVKAATTEALTETEEMLVALKVLRAYFCDAPEMWVKAVDIASDNVTTSARARALKQSLILRLRDEEGEVIDFSSIDSSETSVFARLLMVATKEEESNAS